MIPDNFFFHSIPRPVSKKFHGHVVKSDPMSCTAFCEMKLTRIRTVSHNGETRELCEQCYKERNQRLKEGPDYTLEFSAENDMKTTVRDLFASHINLGAHATNIGDLPELAPFGRLTMIETQLLSKIHPVMRVYKQGLRA